MSILEIEGKSVEEAIAVACEKLKLSREQLDVEVVTKGSSGIFGIVGAKKAKIRVTAKVAPVEAGAESAKRILMEILKHVDIPTVVEAEVREGIVYLNIISNGSGLLIGKRGKTLNSLQYLVGKILQRDFSEGLAVVVDTEDYRSKRESSLVELAQELADKVKKSGRPLTTGPMNAQDRRVIHLALKETSDIRTKSKGEGNLRRVVIYPVKRAKRPRKDDSAAEKQD